VLEALHQNESLAQVFLGQVFFVTMNGADGVGGVAGELARLRQRLVTRLGASLKILTRNFR